MVGRDVNNDLWWYCATGHQWTNIGNRGVAGGLLPRKVLNGSGSLGNSQCVVNGVGSSASINGNTLTLTLNMTFGTGFAGNRVFYLAARDVNELNNTGWQAMGTWTVQ